MGKTAFLFPGQGAQVVGMGKDIAEAVPKAAEVFRRADELLGLPLSRICFEGPAEELNATDIAQPAIFVTSVAMLAAIEATAPEALPAADCAAGLSLGEYTALYCAGCLDFESALGLVRRRGEAMQQAAVAQPSGMVSIMGMGEDAVVDLCRRAANGSELVPANFNCPDQIVISGDKAACGRALELLEGESGVRAVELTVAGAFHSALMAPAARKLRAALAETPLGEPKLRVVANVTGRYHGSPGSIEELLVEQLTRPVRWQQSMEYLLAQGVERFYEIGPGRVLAGLMRRIHRKADFTCVNTHEAVGKLAGRR